LSTQSRLARLRPLGAIRSRPVSARTRRRRLLLLLSLAAAALLLLGAWLWLRDSSLVAVDHVTVSGASGPDAAQIRRALEAQARTMTTLDVRMGDLRTAVAPFPVVKDLRVSTQFPHGMRITVVEQIPVGVIQIGARTVAVAGDGTLLHDVVPHGSLPVISLRVPPGGSRVTDPASLQLVALLAAAPYQLLSHIGQVSQAPPHGLVAQLRSGPAIYFGQPTDLASKWTAATAVLADSGSSGSAYIDVSDPYRPAAGAGSGAAGGSATGSGAAAATGAAASATPTSSTPAAAPASGTGAPATPATGTGAPATSAPGATPTGGPITTPSGG
jgi:cell division protein FtsQ